ncbi:MAG TPA: tetratricopeptide repeat protein [Nitrospiria bacterium]|nr:tetratricopeptide repeat protein [Nitrospiria bacterium]
MKSKRKFYPVRPWWAIAAALLLSAGCIPSPGGPPVGEPPLTPITGGTTDSSQTGQQEASLQLTDEGRQLLDEGRLDEAASVFQKAISLYPNNPYAYYYLGRSRYLKKDYARSLTPLRQAELYLSGDSVWLARVYALRGQIDEALLQPNDARNQYQKALSFDPRNAEAREGLERIQSLTPPTE